MNKILTLGSAVLLSAAMAQPQITPQSIIVNPVQTELNVRVWTDRDTSGQNTPDYRVGDKITLFTTVNQDAYVYLFNISPEGEVTQILPNRLSSGQNNLIRANTTRQFPAPGDNFTFDIGGPAGVYKVLALASRTQLNIDQISQFRSQQSFATVNVRGQERLAQALSIVVNPIPQSSWTTDVAQYRVVTQNPVRTGSLQISSNVAGATVFLNDRQVGTVGNLFTNLQPGTYRVRVTAPGYAEFTGNVTIGANQTVNVNVALEQQRVPLTIRSNVEGATVYINGRQSGTIRNGALSTTLPLGTYEVAVIAPEHKVAVSNVQLRAGGTVTLNLTRLQ